MIKVTVGSGRNRRIILFSGDVGRWNKPILRDPTIFSEADYVLVESTYGDRMHESEDTVKEALANAINSTWKAGGNIIIPSFALERAQEVLYHLNELLLAGKIPHLITFVDSPMAVNVTEVFKKYEKLFDDETISLIRRGESPFHFQGLSLISSTEKSKAINQISGTVIIIAGSGMCTGGRIKHHLVNNISRENSSVLFVGYQANGTLGRSIVDGAKEVRILGEKRRVLANITRVSGFSGHADRSELDRWLSGLKKAPRMTFVIHGETDSSLSFADYLSEKKGWKTTVPNFAEEIMLA
jgi:metallo-beta-lactamase family protein